MLKLIFIEMPNYKSSRFLQRQYKESYPMKKMNRLFRPLFCLVVCCLILESCQTGHKPKDGEFAMDTVYKIPPSPPEWVETGKMLNPKALIDYILSAKTVKPSLKNGRPFDRMDYDKIIAYDFAGCEEPYPAIIDRNGGFVPVVLAQQYLSQVQADKILSTLSSKSTYGEGTAACFHPHFALVFFKDNKFTNQINICLDCNQLSSDIAIPAETHKKVNRGTSDEYALTGFTDKGKREITKLCKELNFTYGQRPMK